MSRCLFAVAGLTAGFARVTCLPLLLIFLLTGLPVLAGPAPGLRVEEAGGETRVTLSLPGRVPFRVFTLDAPPRVVVDFDRTDWPEARPVAPQAAGLVAGLRLGVFRPGESRLVVDLVRSAKVLAAVYEGDSGFRLVLGEQSPEAFRATAGAPEGAVWAMRDQPGALPLPRPRRERVAGEPMIVVLDPGHGGIDPGAVRDGLTEKDLVLGFSRELAARMAATGRFVPILTRDADIFLPLKARVDIAQDNGADVFVSLHLNTVTEGKASGVSVYSLSSEASDSAAARLAEFENRADVLAGLDLEGESSAVTRVLVDMAQRETNQRSRAFAAAIVDQFSGTASIIRSNPHREAGFRVLKAPDIPSVLIELGFLSNASDRAQMQSADWVAAMADDLIAALDTWGEADRAARRLARQ